MSDEPVKPDPEKKPKRPADANQRAKMIVDLATGQEERKDADPSDTHAKRVEAGKVGGEARAESLTPERRQEIARLAAEARWKRDQESAQ